MATAIDSLFLELGLDPRKLIDGLKNLEQQYRATHEGTRRQFQEHEERLGKLGALIAGITRGFTGLVIAAAEVAAAVTTMSKPIAQAGAEFKNLADAAGTDVTTLDAWGRALQRVGGDARDAGRAFAFQQQELQKTRTGLSGAPSWQGYAQRLGLPNWQTYYNSATGQFDVDRLNKDVADAMARQNLSAATRAEMLRAFGWETPAAQRLFQSDLRSRLEAARTTAMTEQNAAAFQRLQERWAELGNTVEAVGRDIVTYLEKPIEAILKAITAVMDQLHGKGVWEAAKQLGSDVARQFREEPLWQFLFAPHLPNDTGQWTPYGAPRRSPQSLMRTPSAIETTPGGAGMVGPPTGSVVPGRVAPYVPPAALSGPAAAAPAAPGALPAQATQAPTVPGASTAPAVTEPFYDPTTGLPMFGPHSSLALPQFAAVTDLPKRSQAFAATPAGGSTTVTNNTTTTIGAMSFHSRASDTEMGIAPSNVAKDLSVGQYSVHANESLE